MYLSSANYLVCPAPMDQNYVMFQFEEFWCKFILIKLMKTILSSLRKGGKPSNKLFGWFYIGGWLIFVKMKSLIHAICLLNSLILIYVHSAHIYIHLDIYNYKNFKNTFFTERELQTNVSERAMNFTKNRLNNYC